MRTWQHALFTRPLDQNSCAAFSAGNAEAPRRTISAQASTNSCATGQIAQNSAVKKSNRQTRNPPWQAIYQETFLPVRGCRLLACFFQAFSFFLFQWHAAIGPRKKQAKGHPMAQAPAAPPTRHASAWHLRAARPGVAQPDACCRQVPRPRHNRAFDGCIGHNMRHVLRPIHLPRCCTAPAC